MAYLKLFGTEEELGKTVKALLSKGFYFAGCEVHENPPKPNTPPITCILFDIQIPSTKEKE